LDLRWTPTGLRSQRTPDDLSKDGPFPPNVLGANGPSVAPSSRRLFRRMNYLEIPLLEMKALPAVSLWRYINIFHHTAFAFHFFASPSPILLLLDTFLCLLCDIPIVLTMTMSPNRHTNRRTNRDFTAQVGLRIGVDFFMDN
jgi:hypothetical protein